MRCGAFTLVEVVVVIAIIAVIAAIAFPILASARESGRMAKCTSNLHQWGVAIDMYRQDWDGIDPAVGLRITSLYQLGLPPTATAEAFRMQYHLNDPAIRFCPSYRPTRGYIGGLYSELFWADNGTPGQVFESLYRRGDDVPLMACAWHNPKPILEDNFPDGSMRMILLRFNHQVASRTFRVYGVNSSDW
jgi:prepilin-type N-terminal cleavage/methylation domain-containing protein